MNKTRELKDLRRAFPKADESTDEEILRFGIKFVTDYASRMVRELDAFKTAVELKQGLEGLTETPKNQALGIHLRQDLVDTLGRLAEVMKGKLENGNTDNASDAGSTEN